jgi:hypothetical protein
MPISTCVVSIGVADRTPPYAVRAARVVLAASATQEGQWNPTEADLMQSGQIGRPQR